MVPHHCTVNIEVEKVCRRTDLGPAVDSGCVILRGTDLRVGVRYTGAVQPAPCDGFIGNKKSVVCDLRIAPCALRRFEMAGICIWKAAHLPTKFLVLTVMIMCCFGVSEGEKFGDHQTPHVDARLQRRQSVACTDLVNGSTATDRHARLPQSVTSGLNLQPKPCDAKSSGQPFLIGTPDKSIAWRVALTFASELMSLMNRCPGFRFATSPNWRSGHLYTLVLQIYGRELWSLARRIA